MKAIINDRLYDTDKAEMLGKTKYGKTYYRTPKGNFFSVRTFPDVHIEEETDFLMKCALSQDIDLYQRIFGEVEEA